MPYDIYYVISKKSVDQGFKNTRSLGGVQLGFPTSGIPNWKLIPNGIQSGMASGNLDLVQF